MTALRRSQLSNAALCALSPFEGASFWRLWARPGLCAAVLLQTLVWPSQAAAQLPASAGPGLVIGDGEAGPSCAFLTGMGEIRWQHPGGDWLDAQGKPQGDRPFSQLKLQRGMGRPFVEMDLSSLVQRWQATPSLPRVVLLRAVGAAGAGDIVDFHSKESPDRAARPMLKLELEDGSRLRLIPAADTFTDCSSLSSLGQRPELKLGGGRHVLLRFEIPESTKVKKAVLMLTSDQQYGSAFIDVGSFALYPSFSRPPQAQDGLAVKYPGDRGISAHADVLFNADFEASNWLRQFGEWVLRGDGGVIAANDAAPGFQPWSGRALKVRIPKGQNLGLDLRYKFAAHGQPEPEELYFRYYLRLGTDWQPVLDGGKLPGIAGTYGKAGWGRRKADGSNGWSVRGGFARRPAGDRSVAELSALNFYAYHADMKDETGDPWDWSQGPTGLVRNERWYCIEQHVKLNQPGKADGVVEAWIDGQQVMKRSGVRLRDTKRLAIEEVWFDVYHGGVSPAPQDMHLYIDNVVIARSYIGPMRAAAPARP